MQFFCGRVCKYHFNWCRTDVLRQFFLFLFAKSNWLSPSLSAFEHGALLITVWSACKQKVISIHRCQHVGLICFNPEVPGNYHMEFFVCPSSELSFRLIFKIVFGVKSTDIKLLISQALYFSSPLTLRKFYFIF